MEQENWQQYGLRFELMQSRQQVDLGGNPEHQGAEEEIDRENVHRADLCLSSTVQCGLPNEHFGRLLHEGYESKAWRRAQSSGRWTVRRHQRYRIPFAPDP